MSCKVLIDAPAWKQLMKLPQAVQERLLTVIEGLEQEPRPSGCKKLQGVDAYRVRSGTSASCTRCKTTCFLCSSWKWATGATCTGNPVLRVWQGDLLEHVEDKPKWRCCMNGHGCVERPPFDV